MMNRAKQEVRLKTLVTDFEHLKASGKLRSFDERSYQELIDYYLRARKLDKALEVAKFATIQYPFRAEFFLSEANIIFRQKRFEECLTVIEKAETIAPYEFDIQILKAKVLGALGFYNLAHSRIAELKKYSNKSDLIDIYQCEASIYEYQEDFDAMFDCLKKSLMLNSENESILRKIFHNVETLKNYEESILLHKIVINKNPYNHLAWYNLGHAYAYVGEYKESINAIEYSFMINPEFEEGYLDCAEICYQLKKYSRARIIYGEYLDQFGEDPEVYQSMAHCFYQEQNYKDALKIVKKSIKLDPYQDEAYYLMANCLIQNGDSKPAIKALNKAISMDDTREEYYHGLARCYTNLGDFALAKQNYYRAALHGIEQSMYWEEYISFLLKLGAYDDAYNKLLEAEQHTFSDKLLYCKAALYFKTQRRTQALSAFEEAMTEDQDNNLSFFYSLVPEYMHNREVKAAVRYFKGV